jgi:hypothetical protein
MAGKRRWEVSDEDICPQCNKPTEWLVDDMYSYAERCPRCKWEVDLDKVGG